MDYQDSAVMTEMLTQSKTIAVVGLSPKQERSSYGVSEYLRSYYEIIPVNPMIDEWQGLKSYASIAEVPKEVTIDMIDVFRRSEEVPAIVDAAIERKIRYIWLQQGVFHLEAAKRAEAAGVKIVMDACSAVAHATLVRSGGGL